MTIDISKNTNVAPLKVGNIEKVFFYWLEFTKPFHNLIDCEIELFAKMLYYRYILSEDIKKEELLDEYLFSLNTKTKIREELKLTQDRFQNLLSALRKKGVITNNKIKKVFIPNLEANAKSFNILLKFVVADASNK